MFKVGLWTGIAKPISESIEGIQSAYQRAANTARRIIRIFFWVSFALGGLALVGIVDLGYRALVASKDDEINPIARDAGSEQSGLSESALSRRENYRVSGQPRKPHFTEPVLIHEGQWENTGGREVWRESYRCYGRCRISVSAHRHRRHDDG